MKRILIISMMMLSAVSVSAGSQKEPVETFDRGIGTSSVVFVPKGTVHSGINFSYKTIDFGQTENDSGYSMLFELLNGIKANMYTFGLAPQFSYFFADNLSAGFRFDYDRSQLNLDNAALSLNDDLGFSISDYHMLQHMFSGSLTLRYYISIANSKRFAIFAEGRMTGAFGQSKIWKNEGGEMYGTYQKITSGDLTFVPGISIFAQDNVAVEVAIGILGINYTRREQIRNQVDVSVMQTSGANFKINPLSIEIGTSFYFYTGPHSKKAKRKLK